MTRRRRFPTRASGPSGRPRHHDRAVDAPHGGSGTLVEELRRTEAALREQKDLSETLLRAQSELGEGVLVLEDGRITYANEAAGRLLGYAAPALVSLNSYLEVFAPEHRAALDERLRGPGRVEAAVETTVLRRDGRRLPVEISAKSMHAGDGKRIVALMRDLSAKKAAEHQRVELASEQAARAAIETEKERWALLARLGERLSASLDYETRTREVARALVPSVADWCAVYVQAGDHEIRLGALEHEDAHRAQLAWESAPAIDLNARGGVASVLRTGEPELRAGRERPVAGHGQDLLSFLGDPPVASSIVVPLTARGRTFGALLLAMADSGRHQDAGDLAFAHEVAGRVALSLDNARLHTEAQSSQTAAEDALGERDVTLRNLRKNLTLVQAIVEGTSDLVFVKDLQGRYILVNSAFVLKFQRSLSETLGRDDAALLPGAAAALSHEHDRAVLDSGEPRTFEENSPIKGVPRTFLVTKAPYRDTSGRLIGIVGIARDITQRKKDEERLASHAAQQEAVSEIGRAALAGIPVAELFDRAVRLVAATASTELAYVFEILPGSDRMVLRAGAGWPDGVVGQAVVAAGNRSHAGFTLSANGPVIVDDMRTEARFRPSQLLLHQGAVSGVTVPIQGGRGPFGVLGAHTKTPRKFANQDVLFLRAVANVLATAIERQRMEAVLREGEERLRTVVMGAPIALFALDAQGRFTLSEGRGLDRLGILPKRALGRTVEEVAPHARDFADQVRQALKGETVTGLIETNDHGFETRLIPIRGADGSVQGAVGVATDVTDRRRSEKRREVQYAVSRLLSEADSIEAAAPQLLKLLAGRLNWEVGLLWLGSKADPTLSCGAAWQDSAEPAEGLVAASRSLRIRRGEGVAGIVWSTGRPVWLSDATRERKFRRSAAAAREGLRSMVCLPITSPRDVFGVLEFFSKNAREVDEDLLRLLTAVATQFGLFVERRLAVLEVQRLNLELESRVGQRTRELEAANRELEAFSYSVSHDLRAPLRTIDGFSKALLEDHSGVLDAEGRHLLDRVRAGTQRMAQLIDDLLKLSRITRSDLQRTPVDLGGLVETTVSALRQQDPARKVDVSVEPGHVVQADAALLRVAIENLVGNAWKFTRGRAEARIEFGAKAMDGETAYFLRDNGAGFDMSYANKLFIPFQRLHRASEFEGSGIGLATVQRIIQRHGGRVWAQARVGEGATFLFTLPAREPVPRPLGSPQSSPS